MKKTTSLAKLVPFLLGVPMSSRDFHVRPRGS